MAKNAKQPGVVIDYTATADVQSGDVVLAGAVLGVALSDIATGETGSVQITGVFEVPKVTDAVFGQGETLTWNVSVGKFDDNAATAATGDVTGGGAFSFVGGANGETTALVKFTGVPGEITA